MVAPHFNGLYSSLELYCDGPGFTGIQEDGCDEDLLTRTSTDTVVRQIPGSEWGPLEFLDGPVFSDDLIAPFAAATDHTEQ